MSNALTNGFKICIEQQITNLTVWKHSISDYDLGIENTDYIGTPETEEYFVDIPGGAILDLSDALTGGPVYKKRDINIKLGKVKAANQQWDTIISNFRNIYHGKRVCICFDSDSSFYWRGRCYIEDFNATRDLGTFTMRIVANPYKESVQMYGCGRDYSDILENDGTKGAEWWIPITNNTTYTDADTTRIQGIIMGTITPTQADFTKYDFNGDGRITSTDYITCQKLAKAILLPLNNKHLPINIANRLPGMTEEITYRVGGSGPSYPLDTKLIDDDQVERNNIARVTYHNSDTKQTFTYLMGADYYQVFPDLYDDSNGYIIVECLCSRTNLQSGDTFTYEGESCTVTNNTTLIQRIVDFEYRERSL